MTEVFVSYKRENLAAVNRLVEALRAEGISVWWDQDIPPNAAWEATIERALAEARLVVVAWSPASVASENVKAEARWARQQGRLLQVFVEACEPPLFFGERQGMDLKHWSGAPADPTFRTLVAAVRQAPTSSPAQAQEAVASPRVGTPLPLPSKPSIAVLPFANRSGDPEQDYFADGMVEEIVGALSRFKSIFVIAAGSSLSFKGQATTPQEAARLLGVRYVLQGSVRKAGGRVRIAAELIDAQDGVQIWADRFEDTLEDVFALQDKVALSVAGVIEPTVRAAEARRALMKPTDNMGSYELYLRAWMLILATSATSEVRVAAELLDRALALDPNYGSALALNALVSAWIAQEATPDAPDGPDVWRRRAVDLAHRAVRAAGDDAMSITLSAGALIWMGEGREVTAAMLDRAMALNPGLFLVWHWRGATRLMIGDAEGAASDVETGMRLDPLSPLRGHQLEILASARFVQRRFDEAVALLTQSAQLIPGYAMVHIFLAAAYGHLGQRTLAQEALSCARELSNRAIDDLVGIWLPREEDQRLVMDGLALAEGG
ncbi:MAG TPA: TIR domain-containing protein [Caulobacteraceae bacterium]|nr:TIR domain-containing protein [Caulobacteraceae bacterium]